MKILSNLFCTLSVLFFFSSCDEILKPGTTLGGSQSPMGEVGVTVSTSSAPIAGVSGFSASVTSLTDGVSTYNAQATVTNTLLKNMVSDFPGVTVNGNTVTITGLKIQQTTEGIKCLTGDGAGIIVKYSSAVGDTYPVGDTGNKRKVVSKSTDDDYPYGFYNIKTIQVETDANNLGSTGGIDKITYIANHKFGLVGVKITFNDATSVTFPVYTNAQN